MLLLDELVLIRNDLLVMLLLLLSRLLLLFLMLGQIVFGDGDDFNSFFSDLIFWEDCRCCDIGHIFRILNIEQVVIFFNQLVRLERAELEVAEELLILIVIVLRDSVRLLVTPAPVTVTVAPATFALLLAL